MYTDLVGECILTQWVSVHCFDLVGECTLFDTADECTLFGINIMVISGFLVYLLYGLRHSAESSFYELLPEEQRVLIPSTPQYRTTSQSITSVQSDPIVRCPTGFQQTTNDMRGIRGQQRYNETIDNEDLESLFNHIERKDDDPMLVVARE